MQHLSKLMCRISLLGLAKIPHQTPAKVVHHTTGAYRATRDPGSTTRGRLREVRVRSSGPEFPASRRLAAHARPTTRTTLFSTTGSMKTRTAAVGVAGLDDIGIVPRASLELRTEQGATRARSEGGTPCCSIFGTTKTAPSGPFQILQSSGMSCPFCGQTIQCQKLTLYQTPSEERSS